MMSRRLAFLMLGLVLASQLLAPSVAAQSKTSGDALKQYTPLQTMALPSITQRVPCSDSLAGTFPCANVDLLAFMPISALGGTDLSGVNDIWGWTDPLTGNEYVVVGRTDGVAFVDISNPEAPIYLGNLPFHPALVNNVPTRPSTWRDMKVYANHVFIVADGAGPHGMQVFDLTQLRSVTAPLTFESTAHYDRINSAHNIVINEDTGYAYIVGASGGGETCGQGLHMINIQDPVNPVFEGCFADTGTGRRGTGYTHDAQCVIYNGPDADFVGQEVCFGSNETALSIADVTDKQAPFSIAVASYPDAAYIHQGWLTEDHGYFFMDDELDERSGAAPTTRTLIWDVRELDDPVLAAVYFGPTAAIDHNQYVVGHYLFQSNYTSGLRILNIEQPLAPVEVAFFDPLPTNEEMSFRGTWSNYPFFASETIAMTSRDEGLFLLKATQISPRGALSNTPLPDDASLHLTTDVFPNPFNASTRFSVTLRNTQQVTIDVFDVQGRKVYELFSGVVEAEQTRSFAFDAGTLPGGPYFIRTTGEQFSVTRKAVLVR